VGIALILNAFWFYVLDGFLKNKSYNWKENFGKVKEGFG
jgi:hypothetical protein